MTNETTDNTDEPTKAELHDRVQQLESAVEKLMPSRRDALKLGAAGIAGAAGLSATSQPADASTGSAGDIGDPNNRPDLFADEIDANQLSGVSTGAIKTKTRVFLSSSSSKDPIPFDSVSYDPDNNFDTTNNEYIVPATGTYLFTYSLRVNQLSAGTRVRVKAKTATKNLAESEITAEGNFASVESTDIRELSSGDSVTVQNTSGVSFIGNPQNSFFSIIRLE